MPDPDFAAFRRELLDAGIALRHVQRTAVELEEHYLDLKDDFERLGLDRDEAEARAARQLGNLDTIVASVVARPELRSWAYRYPRLGRVVLPVACALLLPVTPLIAGVNYAPAIARWSAIMSLSAVITAGMFLVIQLTITLG